MMFRRFALVPLVLTASLGGADAHASTFEPLAFRDVVRRADLAFHGVVVGMHETANASGRMAFTHVKFRVDAAIVDRNLGIVDGHVTLTFAGGTIGSTRIVVAGVPTFAVGDETIVFAHHDGKTYANPCVGGDRGLYRVIRDRANGDAYPLDAASRAIESLPQREGQVRGQTRGQSPGLSPGVGGPTALVADEPVFTDVVLSIESGAIAWRPRATPAAAPLPDRTDRGSAVRESVPAEPSRPDVVLTLASFLESVRAIAR